MTGASRRRAIQGMGVANAEHEYELTHAIGERALSYMREFNTPPEPKCYALLYHYSAGYDEALSKAVAKTVLNQAHLAQSDAERIHETYLGSDRLIRPLHKQLTSQASTVLQVMAMASERNGGFKASLDVAQDGLVAANGNQEADNVVQGLLTASSEMARHNRHLEHRLADSRQQIEVLRQKIADARLRRTVDGLTGLPGLQYFRHKVAQALQQARGRGAPLSLIMTYIDSFASYNGRHGRQLGDKALKRLAALIAELMPPRGVVARYDGDQFAALLPGTRLESAAKIAEQIRTGVISKSMAGKPKGDERGPLTVSLGVALYGYGDSADGLLARAQQCLKVAKRLGRNRIRSAANANTC